jgi:hypothetical protein
MEWAGRQPTDKRRPGRSRCRAVPFAGSRSVCLMCMPMSHIDPYDAYGCAGLLLEVAPLAVSAQWHPRPLLRAASIIAQPATTLCVEPTFTVTRPPAHQHAMQSSEWGTWAAGWAGPPLGQVCCASLHCSITLQRTSTIVTRERSDGPPAGGGPRPRAGRRRRRLRDAVPAGPRRSGPGKARAARPV